MVPTYSLVVIYLFGVNNTLNQTTCNEWEDNEYLSQCALIVIIDNIYFYLNLLLNYILLL